MLDFTLKTLVELYQSLLKNNYTIINMADFLQKKYHHKVCVLRHDVDRGIKNALLLAALEKNMDITASYYFRYPYTFDVRSIKKIRDLQHEIGYHYEVLAKTSGTYEEAIALFKKELEVFRGIVDIKTICAHGSPLARWDNKKLWDRYNFHDFELIGEAYLSVNFNEVLYVSDTGRSWNNDANNIRDRVETQFVYHFNDTKAIITAIKNSALPDKLIFNIHPNRWNDNLFLWTTELLGQNIKNVFKRMIIHV